MALKFNRKKADDQTQPINENQFADLIPDSVKTPTAPVTNVPDQTVVVAKRKGPSPAMLGAGAFLLTAGALGAWWMQKEAQEETQEAAATPSLVQSSPGASASPMSSAAPNASPVAAGSEPRVAPSGERVVRVSPGQAGIKSPDTPAGVPIIAPGKPGTAPRLVPVKGSPTPISPPDGLAGRPGVRANRGQVQVTKPLAAAMTPALQKQLDRLWQQGADAKHRNDYAGARRAWTRILQLKPGHRGIQQAIDKLPRRS